MTSDSRCSWPGCTSLRAFCQGMCLTHEIASVDGFIESSEKRLSILRNKGSVREEAEHLAMLRERRARLVNAQLTPLKIAAQHFADD